MTLSEYQERAARTMNPELDDNECFYHGLFGLVSEVGEMTGIIQKNYQGHDMDGDHFVDEMGDVLWMIAEICTAIGVSLDEVAERNIEKLMKRYPEGFDPERSLHREEEG